MKIGKIFRYTILFLLCLAVLACAGYAYTHYLPSGRILYKRMKAENEFIFDKMQPEKVAVDPAKYITVRSASELKMKQMALDTVVLGDDRRLTDRLPQVEIMTEIPAGMENLPSLELVEKLSLPFEVPYEPAYTAVFYHMRPKGWNGRVVQYHHGYAGRIAQQETLIIQLLEAGYAVIAHNFYGYGKTPVNVVHKDFGPLWLGYDLVLKFVDDPLRLYIEPVFAAGNHLAQRHGINQMDMIGFSAGGWVTTIAAGIDTRIKRAMPLLPCTRYICESCLPVTARRPPTSMPHC